MIQERRPLLVKEVPSEELVTLLDPLLLILNKVSIKYENLSPKMVGKTIDCISVSFATPQDPFTRSLGLSQAQWGVMSRMFVHRAAQKNLSLVAINEETEQIEGVIINEDWKEKQPSDYSMLEDWAPVRAIFNELHTRFKSIHPMIEHGKVLHPLYFTCVRQDVRRQGIVSSLWERSVEIARNRNYEQMVAESGNPTSYSVFVKLGFQEAAKVDFSEFKFQGQNPFSNLPQSGFTQLTMFKRSISSNLYM